MSETSSISEDSKITDKIFVVPYRDREPHKTIFSHYMTHLLEGQNYEIYYIEQNDKRHFNRGALKNIGFMVGKEKYPNHYRNITFIFHDIDLLISFQFLHSKGRRANIHFATAKLLFFLFVLFA